MGLYDRVGNLLMEGSGDILMEDGGLILREGFIRRRYVAARVALALLAWLVA